MLKRREPNTQLCSRLETATSFATRAKGLIGTRSMKDYALLFPKCNWIHTFFMSVPIDVIYVDKDMKIKKIDHSLQPWRMPLPVFTASTVIEVEAGLASKHNLQVGEELHVGH